MATMRSLGFSIFSRYDGSGVAAARRDIDGFNVTLTRSSGVLNSWSGRLILAAKAAAVFGPALLPIAANLTAVAGAATAMAASVGTALAAYGLAMKNAITQTNAMAKAGKTLSAAQKDFISSQNAFNKAMANFGSSFRDESLKAAAATLKGMTTALKAMEPVARAIAPEITKVALAFEKWTKGDSFKNYVNLIKASAVPAFRNLVAAGKDVINVLGDGFRAFLPHGVALTEVLKNGAAALRQWSDGGGFQRFLAYVKETSPAVKEFFKALWDAVKNIVAVMRELAPVSLLLVTSFLQIVAALPPEWISAVVQGFILFKTAMLGLMVIGKLVAIFHALRGAWMILSLAFTASPLGLVVIAVMAVIAAITLLIIHWDTVSAALKVAWSATWNFLKMVAEAVWNALKIAWAAFTGAFATAWTAVAAAFTVAWQATWNAIQLVATTIWNALTVAWNAFVNALSIAWTTVSAAFSAAWSAVWTAIQLVATTVWTALTVAWTAFINGLSIVWTAVSAALSAAWSATWTAIQLVASTIWTALTTAWSAFINGLSIVWTTVSAALSAAWSATWTAIQLVASTIWTALTTAWSAFINGLSVVWTAVSGALSAAWSATWTAIQLVATTIWTALTTAWSAFINGLSTVWSAVSGALSAAWSATWTAIQTVATAIWTALTAAWSAFINGLSTVWSAVSGALSAAWSATWNAISTAAQAIWTAMTAAWNAFINGLQSVWSAVSGALSAAWSATWNAMSAAAQAIWSALTAAWNAFINGMSSLWSAVSSALSSSWSAVWSAMQSAAQAVWSALQAAWQAFLSAAQAAWSAFSAALSAAWNAMWNAISTLARTIWTAMQVAWQLFLTTVQTAWTVFSTAFSAAWNAMWTAIQLAATTIWTALQTAWTAFLTAVRAAYDAFMSALSEAWSAAWTAIQAAAQAVWDAMKAAWQAFVDGVMAIYNTFSEALKSAWDATWNALLSAARSIWSTIGGVIEKAINGVISIVNGLIKGFNNVASFLQIDVSIGEIGSVSFPGLADGGVVTFAYGGMTGGPEGFAKGGTVNLRKGGTLAGYAPGRDTVPAMLSKGEGVLTPEAVRGLGGPGFINGANRQFAGHRGAGKGGAPARNSSVQIQNFAVGGLVSAALARAGVPSSLVSQGEYSNGSLSAGTHAGGGVVDISSTSPAIVAALRAAGFAAWARTGAAWAGNEHIHAVLMNHPDLSGPAAAQVADFLAGGDGLGAGGGGGGGIPGWLQSIIDKGAEIISAVAQGKDISNIIGDLLPGGGDNEDGEGLFGTGIGPDVGPDLVPGTDIQDALGNAAGALAKFVIPGFGELGKLLLGLLPDSAFEMGFKWITDMMGGFSNPAGGFGEIAIAMGKKLIKGAIDFLIGKNNDARAEAMAQFAGGGGGDVSQWSALAGEALARAGISASQLPAFLALMQAESGGNPNARNNTDVNAQNGVPSQGLMQVIPPTFATHRDPSLPNNILDPLANMTAAARYIKSRYGGNVPGSPYALGTPGATAGPHLVGELGPELVNFKGGETVTPAKETAGILSAAAAPAVSAVPAAPITPPVPTATGMPESAQIASPMMEQLKQFGSAAQGEGWFGDIIAAAQHMVTTVQQAWSGTVQAGVAATPAINATASQVAQQVGANLPATLETMANSSTANWSEMNSNALTNWAAMQTMVFTPAEMHQGTTMPLTSTAMNTASTTAWTNMNLQAATQWGLMRDTTFTESELHQGTTMPENSVLMQTASDLAWTTMNTTSATEYTAIETNQIVPFEEHMATTMPEASVTMQEAVGTAFTEMVAVIIEQLDLAIAKIQEFIAATQAAIAAAQALAAAQAAAGAAGGAVGGMIAGGGSMGTASAALAAAGITPDMIIQGEHSDGALSAGTHTGTGVYDINSTSPAVLAALQAAGFQAVIRGPADGMSPHIHAIQLGNPGLSPQAQAQIGQFARGTNHAMAGWSWVGEDGPELMRMRGGEQVMPNRQSMAYASRMKKWSGNRGGSSSGCGSRNWSRDVEEAAASVSGSRNGSDREIHVEFNFNGPVANGDEVRRAVDEAIPKLRSALQAGSGRRIGG